MDVSCDLLVSDHCHQLLKELNKQRHQEYFCDVIIQVCDGKMFPAHRCVLAASSNKFHALMQNDFLASLTMPNEVNANGFQSVLEYIYTGILDINLSNVHDVLIVASYLDLTSVENSCHKFLKSVAPKKKRYPMPTPYTEENKTTTIAEANVCSQHVSVTRETRRMAKQQAVIDDDQQPVANDESFCDLPANQPSRRSEPDFTTEVPGHVNQLCGQSCCVNEFSPRKHSCHDSDSHGAAEIASVSINSNKVSQAKVKGKRKSDKSNLNGQQKNQPIKKKITRKAKVADFEQKLEQNTDDDIVIANSRQCPDSQDSESKSIQVVLPVSEKLSNENPMRNESQLVSCNICGMSFSRASSLTRHARSHSSVVYACANCDAVFNHPSKYKRHSKLEHGQRSVFRCSYPDCQFRSDRLSNVEKHAIIHSDVRVHSCVRCGRTFSHEHGLVSHLRSCYEMRPYLCDLCGAAFNHLQSMQSHRRIHTGEKPYQCTECGSHFADQRNLKRHRRIHENVFPYACMMCDKKFRHSNSLKAHIAGHQISVSNFPAIVGT